MTDKEQIMIDVNKCKYRDSYTNFCLAEKDDIGETYTICTGTDCYFKQLARKAQECEKLEDFRTLTREVFTFGDSDVDDENFIKYLQEYSRSYEEAIDGYFRLTVITGIDNTVHGGADIEEIIKRVDVLKQECERSLKRISDLEERIINHSNEIEEYCSRLADKNKKCEKYEQALEEIEAATKINCEEICGRKFADCNDTSCFSAEILDIINKAKGEE